MRAAHTVAVQSTMTLPSSVCPSLHQDGGGGGGGIHWVGGQWNMERACRQCTKDTHWKHCLQEEWSLSKYCRGWGSEEKRVSNYNLNLTIPRLNLTGEVEYICSLKTIGKWMCRYKRTQPTQIFKWSLLKKKQNLFSYQSSAIILIIFQPWAPPKNKRPQGGIRKS